MLELSTASDLIQILYVFAMGVLSSLTPCVYPMIPITLSLFGAVQASRKQAFFLSLCYVLGIATTYTILGMICAKTGMLFGSLLSIPWVVLALCSLLVILSLHTFEIINLPFSKLQSRAGAVGGTGIGGAFLMGTVSGAVAAPCVGPVLALILVEAARSADVAWGAALLFSYSMGLGLLFLIVGTFSGLLTGLPRSGNWLYGVKYLIATGLLMAAFFLLRSLRIEWLKGLAELGGLLLWLPVAVLTAALAFYCQKHRLTVAQFATAVVLAFSILSCVQPAPAAKQTVTWHLKFEDAIAAARAESKLVMIDMFADWCAACKELDHTFSNSRVADTLRQNLVTARIDFTQPNDEAEALSNKFEVVGLPCVLFLTAQGAEIRGSRISGYLSPDEFMKHLAAVGIGS